MYIFRLISAERARRPARRWENWLTRAAGVLILAWGCAGLARARVAWVPTQALKPAVVFAARGGVDSATSATSATTRGRLALDVLQTSVTARVRPFMEKWPAAALTVGVLDEQTSAVLGFGRARASDSTPPGPRSLYEIGSITKVFTAACLELLAERGRVGLADPVQRYYDPAKVRIPDYRGKQITLLHLTTHASGLPRMPEDFAAKTTLRGAPFNPYSVYSAEDLFAFLNKCKLQRAPGARVEYSNMGVGLLGLTLARREGVSYETLVRRLVCAPLGLGDTVMTLTPEQRGRLVPGFSTQVKLGPLVPASGAPNWTFQDSFAGAGALRSSAADLLHFLAVNAGLTSSPLAGALQQTHAFRVKENERMSMGMGWIRTPLKGKDSKDSKDGKDEKDGKDGKEPIIWHNGGTGGYRTFLAFHRPSRTGVVVLSNTTDDEVDRIGFDVLRMLQQIDGAKP